MSRVPCPIGGRVAQVDATRKHLHPCRPVASVRCQKTGLVEDPQRRRQDGQLGEPRVGQGQRLGEIGAVALAGRCRQDAIDPPAGSLEVVLGGRYPLGEVYCIVSPDDVDLGLWSGRCDDRM